MGRCTIGRVFALVLIAIAFILAATLLSDYNREPDNFHRALKLVHQQHSSKRMKPSKTELKGSQRVNQSVVDNVDTFVMFIGYPRSGHSIIGSCLDAHQDVIVAHEFNLMTKLMNPELLQVYSNRTVLFDALYQNSFRQSLLGWRSPEQNLAKKGYTLKISSNGSWQGKFRKLRVIGDKSGGLTTHGYRDSPMKFITAYKELSQIVKMPIKFIHVVRNPYDIIATKLSYRLSEKRGRKGNFSASRPMTSPHQIMLAIKSLEVEAKAVQESIDKLQLTTLEVHNMDFILRTKRTVLTICEYIGLECSDQYLQLCDDVAYDKPSRSRDSVKWTQTSKRRVDQLIQEYPFFGRYSFTVT
jgi:hypothetical protein